MKKRTINAFTLVEMLIVIVIIGILIAALMPRMQSAQGRARDVARKNDLAQIQTAIVTSQQDKGNWPGMAGTQKDGSSRFTDDEAKDGMKVSEIKDALITAGMSSVPKDPLESSEVSGLGGDTFTGDYAYMVATSNGTENGGFVLMAKTEIEGGSNWIVCDSGSSNRETGLSGGFITSSTDIKDVIPCGKMTKVEDAAATKCRVGSGECYYHYDGQLRYILKY